MLSNWQGLTRSNCSRLRAPAHMMHGSHVTYSWHLRTHEASRGHRQSLLKASCHYVVQVLSVHASCRGQTCSAHLCCFQHSCSLGSSLPRISHCKEVPDQKQFLGSENVYPCQKGMLGDTVLSRSRARADHCIMEGHSACSQGGCTCLRASTFAVIQNRHGTGISCFKQGKGIFQVSSILLACA